MRDPNLIPWDYPEYFAIRKGEIPYQQEDNDYSFDCDTAYDIDDDYCCDRCGGRGCNWCLMTDY